METSGSRYVEQIKSLSLADTIQELAAVARADARK